MTTPNIITMFPYGGESTCTVTQLGYADFGVVTFSLNGNDYTITGMCGGSSATTTIDCSTDTNTCRINNPSSPPYFNATNVWKLSGDIYPSQSGKSTFAGLGISGTCDSTNQAPKITHQAPAIIQSVLKKYKSIE